MLKYTNLLLAAAACACFVNGLREFDTAKDRVRLERAAALGGLEHDELTEALTLAGVNHKDSWSVFQQFARVGRLEPAVLAQALVGTCVSNEDLSKVYQQIDTAKDNVREERRADLRDLQHEELAQAFTFANVVPADIDKMSDEELLAYIDTRSDKELLSVHQQIAPAKKFVGKKTMTIQANVRGWLAQKNDKKQTLNRLDKNVLAKAFTDAGVVQIDMRLIKGKDLSKVYQQAARQSRAALGDLHNDELALAFMLAHVQTADIRTISDGNSLEVFQQIVPAKDGVREVRREALEALEDLDPDELAQAFELAGVPPAADIFEISDEDLSKVFQQIVPAKVAVYVREVRRKALEDLEPDELVQAFQLADVKQPEDIPTITDWHPLAIDTIDDEELLSVHEQIVPAKGFVRAARGALYALEGLKNPDVWTQACQLANVPEDVNLRDPEDVNHEVLFKVYRQMEAARQRVREVRHARVDLLDELNDEEWKQACRFARVDEAQTLDEMSDKDVFEVFQQMEAARHYVREKNAAGRVSAPIVRCAIDSDSASDSAPASDSASAADPDSASDSFSASDSDSS